MDERFTFIARLLLDGIVAKLETWQRIEMWFDQDSRPPDELDFENPAAVSALRDARTIANAK